MEIIKPLGERLLVLPHTEENPVWIGDEGQTMIRAKVIEIGDVDEKFNGVTILMPKSAGVSLQINEVEHKLLRVADAWAIIESNDNAQ